MRKKGNNPIVFISYSHDSPKHVDDVLDFSDQLRSDGIDCILDQYETSPPEGWTKWMDRHIGNSDFVIMICTETYYRRVMGKEKTGEGLGAKWEVSLIYQYIHDADTENTRFIPVLFKSGKPEYIPTPLRSATRYPVDTKQGYEELYRRLTGQPPIKKPKLGRLRKLPLRERKQDFFATPAKDDNSRLTQIWNIFKQKKLPQKSLRKLVLLQYPWGEFSDVRTSKELRAAERPGSYIVPKPNVARTLFTIEALKELDKELFKPQIQSALKWVSQCIVDGWFKEWLPGPVLDSESSEPALRKQPSVRHTAQAGIIHVQFPKPKKDGSLIKGILENILKSQLSQSHLELLGAWPENPNDTNPAFFSTFYALEFLSRIVEGQFRLDVDDLIHNGKTRVKNALSLGFNWLSRDITRGNGLGGASTGGASSYWTAMMLYRLGWKFLAEYLEVRGKIVEALERSCHSFGWYHEPRGRPRDKRSKQRYNIRVLAGLCAIGKEGLGYEYQLIRKAGQVTADSFDLRVVDTPDCALVVQIATWLGKDDAKRTLVDSYKPYLGRLRQNRLERWCRRFSLVRESLRGLKDQGIPDYSDAYEEVDNKVQMLEEEIYVLKKRKKNEG